MQIGSGRKAGRNRILRGRPAKLRSASADPWVDAAAVELRRRRLHGSVGDAGCSPRDGASGQSEPSVPNSSVTCPMNCSSARAYGRCPRVNCRFSGNLHLRVVAVPGASTFIAETPGRFCFHSPHPSPRSPGGWSPPAQLRNCNEEHVDTRPAWPRRRTRHERVVTGGLDSSEVISWSPHPAGDQVLCIERQARRAGRICPLPGTRRARRFDRLARLFKAAIVFHLAAPLKRDPRMSSTRSTPGTTGDAGRDAGRVPGVFVDARRRRAYRGGRSLTADGALPALRVATEPGGGGRARPSRSRTRGDPAISVGLWSRERRLTLFRMVGKGFADRPGLGAASLVSWRTRWPRFSPPPTGRRLRDKPS
jgi:hypothetical protein